jgi:hypothetical protein
MKDKYYIAFKGTAEENARLHGLHTTLEGAVHKRFTDNHIIKEFDVEAAKKDGFSFARVIDAHPQAPMVIGWFAFKRHPEPVIYQFRELIVKDRLASDTAKIVKEMSQDIPIQFSILDTPESTSDKVLGTNIRMEFARAGIPTLNPIRNLYMGILRFDEYLETMKFFITEDCPYSIYSIRVFRWDTWHTSSAYDKPEKEKPVKKDDHAVRNVHYMILTMPPLNEFKARLRQGEQMRRSRYYIDPRVVEKKYHTMAF